MKLHWITTRKRLTSLWKVSEILPIKYIINTERSWGGLGTSGEILRAWCTASFWWCLGAFSWRSSFPAFLFLQKKWQASNYQLRKNQRLLKHGFKTTVHDFKMAQLSLSLRLLAKQPLWTYQINIRGVLARHPIAIINLLCHENDNDCCSMIGQLFTMTFVT